MKIKSFRVLLHLLCPYVVTFYCKSFSTLNFALLRKKGGSQLYLNAKIKSDKKFAKNFAYVHNIDHFWMTSEKTNKKVHVEGLIDSAFLFSTLESQKLNTSN